MDARWHRVQHLPFFEALAELEESSSEWRTTLAGLVTLRLFDHWVCHGRDMVASDKSGLRAVREAIAAVSTRSTVRTILTSVVDSMQTAQSVQPARVLPRLLAYARALQLDAHWQLAIDVYRTVIRYADPFQEPDIVIGANMQMGSCYRTIGDVRAAATAYRAAGELAATTNDIMNVLRSRIREANLAIDRGNLPRAEVILDQAIQQAEGQEFTDIRAAALNDRGRVAFQRGQFSESVQFAFRALQDTREPTERDRVLGGIAACFVELGLRSAARDAYLIIAATAQEQYMRWLATINLMEIAALDRSEPVFERYRRDLASEELPPSLSAYYFYYIGVGQQLFGRYEQAQEAFKHALDISTAHDLNQLVIETEERLQELASGRHAAERAPAPTAQDTVIEITKAIRQMRETAGVEA